MIEYDLVLDEEEVVNSKEGMKELTKHLNDKMNAYITCVETVLKDGVVEGESHEGLEMYVESVKKMKEEMTTIIQAHIIKESEQYIVDFDDADDVIF